MIRNGLVFAALLLASGAPAAAQEWATKMFDKTSHAFGTVARGAKSECRFTLTNLYLEDVHIASVRSSCGCATPQVTRSTLKTYEKGEIVAQFNTRAFLGEKSATITVTFDQPYYAEVQLQITGYIRSDVVLDPGSVNFGSVVQGTKGETTLAINYAGRDTWQIVDVVSANRHLEAELRETSRGSGKVSYNLLVRLKPDAPVGYFRDQLTLVTNDQRSTQVPVDVEGQVTAEVTVSPASLFMGVVGPGQKVTKQLVVRGARPFKIVSIECPDECFEFSPPATSGPLHLVPVTFTAGQEPGKVTHKIRIHTDFGETVVPELNVYAEVVRSEP